MSLHVALRHRFASFHLDVAFETEGGITALFGASGAGKTTIVDAIAGLVAPDAGRIVLAGTTLLDTATGLATPSHRRRIGYVFQDARLFPHLTVRQNLLFGRAFARGRDGAPVAFDDVVGLLGLGTLLARRPGKLSGGERQRVAIGRALLARPKLLLMDEPLASLDGARKLEILPFIERLRDQFEIPMLYVSHSVEEVARLASHVVQVQEGRVLAAGPPAHVLAQDRPALGAERFEAVSVLKGRLDRHLDAYQVSLVAHPAGTIVVPGIVASPGALVSLVIRATNVILATEPAAGLSVRTMLAGAVASIAGDDGPLTRVAVTLQGGETLQAYVTRLAADALGLKVGDRVYALVKTAAIDERGAGMVLRSPPA